MEKIDGQVCMNTRSSRRTKHAPFFPANGIDLIFSVVAKRRKSRRHSKQHLCSLNCTIYTFLIAFDIWIKKVPNNVFSNSSVWNLDFVTNCPFNLEKLQFLFQKMTVATDLGFSSTSKLLTRIIFRVFSKTRD